MVSYAEFANKVEQLSRSENRHKDLFQLTKNITASAYRSGRT